jgi:hypothetical protein
MRPSPHYGRSAVQHFEPWKRRVRQSTADILARGAILQRPFVLGERMIGDMVDNVVGFVLGFIYPKTCQLGFYR